MFDVLRTRRAVPLAGGHFNPLTAILRLDAAWRERRRLEELTPEQLHDVGLTRAELERALR